MSDEHKAKIREWNRNHWKTHVHPNKGKIHSKEQNENHKALLSEYFKTHCSPMKGKKLSEEAKIKMSLAQRGTK